MADVQESAVMVNHADAVAPDAALPDLPSSPPQVEPLSIPLSAAPSNCPSPVVEVAEALPSVAENNPFAQSWNCSGRMDELDKRCEVLETKFFACVSVIDFLQQVKTVQSVHDEVKCLHTRVHALEICSQNDAQTRTTHEKKTCWATGLAVVGVLLGAAAVIRSFWK